MSVVALDLFAGTGWGVACQRLGIEEHGVELMPEARAVRERNGMHTIYADAWEGLTPDLLGLDVTAYAILNVYNLLIASPPCQTFSMAGAGSGRQALDEVLAAIDARLYLDPAKLRAFGDEHDPRTALVLTPLAHIARDTPTYVVLEQVPPVLPVWERYAEEMRHWGYSVWTGNLQAEQYGVPQTRKRAILIARADGKEAKAPTPTHSRYYSRDPQRLDEGVLPWVSMAEALGWGKEDEPIGRPAPTVTGSGAATGGAEPFGRHGRAIVEKMAEDWQEARPATTIAGDSRVWPPGHKVNSDDARRLGDDAARERYGDRAGTKASRVTVAEAAALQSYPADFDWNATIVDEKTGRVKPITKTNQFLQIGNAVPPLLAEAILREVLS